MKWTKYSILTIIFSLIINAFSAAPTFAQENLVPTKPTLFVSESCGYCNNLKEYIATNSIEELVDMDILDVSIEETVQIYQATTSSCEIETTSVPLMYSDGECLIGYSPVKQEIDSLAGITEETTENIDEEETNESTEISEADGSTNEEETNSNSTTLSDRLNEDSNTPQTEISLKDMLLIVIPLVLFGVIAYLLITKLKL